MHLLHSCQLLIYSGFSSIFLQRNVKRSVIFFNIYLAPHVHTNCHIQHCCLPHRHPININKKFYPIFFFSSLKLIGILSLSQTFANRHSGAGPKYAEIIISIYLNCQHVMNSGGMPSIQINLLLEKDFLHKCCQTRKQLGDEKKM